MRVFRLPLGSRTVLRKPTLEVYGGLGKLDFPKVRSPQNHLNDEPRLTQRDY